MPDVMTLPISQAFDLSKDSEPIMHGQLKLGGSNPKGHRIGFTNLYMTWDDQPCIPIMGEFHFSRYAHEYWEDELLKIKAGGVDIIATYVFWNHVEEDEGQFDWSGDNDLHTFVTLCGRHDLQAIVRIGPFAHGECRNGGLPDWLYGRPFAVRSNDQRYLAYVRRLYGEIAGQLDGLLFKDGGPVVGIQLENEYMHAGAPWEVTYRQGTEFVPSGADGEAHILILKQIAQDVGLDVPIYSCTGWLDSPVPDGEVLPMHGGYVFTPWIPDPDFKQPPTHEFLFRDRHLRPVINGEPTYDPSKYPYACCEIGAGSQDTYYHRNPVPPEAVEGLALMNLAGGANLIGYYMYHGGTNPVGKHSFMNEYTVPRRSYDFQAPLREFGQRSESYRVLRLLHSFLRDFGDLLAPMQVTLPDNAVTITPDNTTEVRCAVRSRDGAGFLFLNSYQDHVDMCDLEGRRFTIRTDWDTFSIPQSQTMTLKKNVSAILPFGLSLSGVRLCSATVQLLAKLETDDAVNYFFFAPRGMISEYVLEAGSFYSLHVENDPMVVSEDSTIITITPGLNAVITLTNRQGQTVRLFTLTRDQAEQTSKQLLWGRERLVISTADVVAAGEECRLYSREPEIDLLIFPPLDAPLSSAGDRIPASKDGLFTRYRLSLPPKDVYLSVDQLSPDKAVVKLPPDLTESVDNVYLCVDYVGDIGNCYVDGQLVADNFYNGTMWEIGLKQILRQRPVDELYFLITPTRRNVRQAIMASSAMAFVPGSAEIGVAAIHAVEAVLEYRVSLTLPSV